MTFLLKKLQRIGDGLRMGNNTQFSLPATLGVGSFPSLSPFGGHSRSKVSWHLLPVACSDALTYSRVRRWQEVRLSSPISVLRWVPARWLHVPPVTGSSLFHEMTTSATGDSDCCTAFLFVCTELKSACLGAPRGQAVSTPPSEAAGLHRCEEASRLASPLSPPLVSVPVSFEVWRLERHP